MADTATNKRNTGIDLLRLISMFYIVMIHVLSKGGVLANVNEGSRTSYAAWLLFAFGSCAVNIFGLITGYVSYSDDTNSHWISRWLRLWFEVVYYGITIRLIKCVFFGYSFSVQDLRTAIFPVYYNENWYFSAYTGLLLLAPCINLGLKKIPEKSAPKLFWILAIIMPVYGSFSPYDSFGFSGGQTVMWLVVLYALGALIKKTNMWKQINPMICVAGIPIFAVMAAVFRNAHYNIINCDVSPLLLGQAILYMFFFIRMEFSEGWKKIIGFASAGSFSVILIEHQIPKDFAFVSKAHVYELVPIIVLASAALVIACVLIDRIRIYLFGLIGIGKLARAVEDKILRLQAR